MLVHHINQKFMLFQFIIQTIYGAMYGVVYAKYYGISQFASLEVIIYSIADANRSDNKKEWLNKILLMKMLCDNYYFNVNNNDVIRNISNCSFLKFTIKNMGHAHIRKILLALVDQLKYNAILNQPKPKQ